METKTIETVIKDKSQEQRAPDFKSFDGRFVGWTGESKAGNTYIKIIDKWSKDRFFLLQNFKD